MNIRIRNEPIPEGKTVQRIRLIDAIRMARKEPVLVQEPHGVQVFNITQEEFEQGIFYELIESLDRKEKENKFHRICRTCKKPFIVWRGCKREHARLCICCEFLANQRKRRYKKCVVETQQRQD